MHLLERFFSLSVTQIQQFILLQQLYQEWNEKINVISRQDISHLVEKHFLHSLSIGHQFAFEKNINVLDIGTGGGLPGVPLAILFPETNFILVDATRKKIHVIEHLIEQLKLPNINPLWSRVEQLDRQDIDVVVSRATASLEQLLAWAGPVMNIKSNAMYQGLICLKGGDLTQEIKTSKAQVQQIDLHEIFDLDYYRNKAILFVPYKNQQQ